MENKWRMIGARGRTARLERRRVRGRKVAVQHLCEVRVTHVITTSILQTYNKNTVEFGVLLCEALSTFQRVEGRQGLLRSTNEHRHQFQRRYSTSILPSYEMRGLESSVAI
jgi:hypothetical protein